MTTKYVVTITYHCPGIDVRYHSHYSSGIIAMCEMEVSRINYHRGADSFKIGRHTYKRYEDVEMTFDMMTREEWKEMMDDN